MLLPLLWLWGRFVLFSFTENCFAISLQSWTQVSIQFFSVHLMGTCNFFVIVLNWSLLVAGCSSLLPFPLAFFAPQLKFNLHCYFDSIALIRPHQRNLLLVEKTFYWNFVGVVILFVLPPTVLPLLFVRSLFAIMPMLGEHGIHVF